MSYSCSPCNSAIHLFFHTPASPLSGGFEPQKQRNIRKNVSDKHSSCWGQFCLQKKSGRQQKGTQHHQLEVDDHPTSFALTFKQRGRKEINLTLWKEILSHFYKKLVENPITSTRGILPPSQVEERDGLLDCVDLVAWHIRPTGA